MPQVTQRGRQGVRLFGTRGEAQGGRRGEVSDQPVGSVDLVPTILETVGVEAPSRFAAGLDGRSIAGYWAGREGPPGFPVFSERPEWCLVRDGDWKLVADREESGDMTPRMLFNLRADPFEMQDRLNDSAAGERAAHLTSMLREWDQRVRAIPTPRGGPRL